MKTNKAGHDKPQKQNRNIHNKQQMVTKQDRINQATNQAEQNNIHKEGNIVYIYIYIYLSRITKTHTHTEQNSTIRQNRQKLSRTNRTYLEKQTKHKTK